MMQPWILQGLRCGSLAKAAAVSADTIRHYERLGVLPKADRTAAGYRIYPENAVERVLVVQRALRIGFTLAELAEVLKTRDSGGAPCRQVFEMAQEKLKGIEADIEALQSTRRYLKKVLSDWKGIMEETGSGQRSHLLQSLTLGVRGDRTKNRLRRKRKQ